MCSVCVCVRFFFCFIKIHLSPTEWPYKRVYANILNWWTLRFRHWLWCLSWLLRFVFPLAIDTVVFPKIQILLVTRFITCSETISLCWCVPFFTIGFFWLLLLLVMRMVCAVSGISVVWNLNFGCKIQHLNQRFKLLAALAVCNWMPATEWMAQTYDSHTFITYRNLFMCPNRMGQ